MQRAGVPADEEPGVPRERDQFADGALERTCRASTGGFDLAGERFFSGTMVHNGLQTLRGESAGYASVTLTRPAFCAPSGSGIQDGELANRGIAKRLRDATFSGFITRKFH